MKLITWDVYAAHSRLSCLGSLNSSQYFLGYRSGASFVRADSRESGLHD
jgi:hypothetical protein